MLGIIGGSGLCSWADLEDVQEQWVDTPYGKPSSAILLGFLAGVKVAFLARHGNPHRLPPHCVNYRANIWALYHLGVKSIVAVNAVGGISVVQDTGVISLPDQIIDYTYGRAHTFSDSDAVPLQHVDFSYPYSAQMRQHLLAAASHIQLPLVDGAVHAVTQGPRLESAAEIRRLANDGCDIVGMTGMPEAGLARELALEFACVSLVVNKAAGLSDAELTLDAMHEVMNDGICHVKKLINAYCYLSNKRKKTWN